MDRAGDMGLGYSVSGPSQFPSIRYTGRVPGDAAGTMESEASLREGSGSQTGTDRWGDYSSMRSIPATIARSGTSTSTTQSSANSSWHTRIGSFKFNSCGAGPTPDFSLAANPTSFSRVQGQSGTSTITVNAINNFNASTTLSVFSGCPTNATCTFGTNPVGAGASSVLTVSTSGSTPATTYSVVVQGVSGALTHTTTVTVTVTAAPVPDFSLTANPTSFSRVQGQSGTSTITVNAINNFNGSTTLSVFSGCPTGATCTFGTNPVAAGASSILTVSTSATTPANTYNVVVQGTSGVLSHTTTVAVTVTPPASSDFSIALSSSSLTVRRRSNGAVTVTLSPIGPSSSVTLSVSGLPSKVSATFTPNPVGALPGSSTLRISANPNAATGTFNVTVTGNNGTASHSQILALTVTK